jgi:DNA-binding transcriptional MerR regulator
MADNVISAGEFLRRIDERSLPRYTCGEAARYLHVPESTVRAWFHGTVYGSAPHIKQFRPILVPSDSELLSFYDIASAHILSAFKRAGVSPADLRVIVNSLKSEFPNSPYPLLGKEFHRFGNDVVLKVAGQILNLNRGRQLGIKKVMQKFLSRIDVDANRMPYLGYY